MSPGGYRDGFSSPRRDYGMLAALVSMAVIWGGFLYLAWEWMT